jgi:hypothetical protein
LVVGLGQEPGLGCKAAQLANGGHCWWMEVGGRFGPGARADLF